MLLSKDLLFVLRALESAQMNQFAMFGSGKVARKNKMNQFAMFRSGKVARKNIICEILQIS